MPVIAIELNNGVGVGNESINTKLPSNNVLRNVFDSHLVKHSISDLFGFCHLKGLLNSVHLQQVFKGIRIFIPASNRTIFFVFTGRRNKLLNPANVANDRRFFALKDICTFFGAASRSFALIARNSKACIADCTLFRGLLASTFSRAGYRAKLPGNIPFNKKVLTAKCADFVSFARTDRFTVLGAKSSFYVSALLNIKAVSANFAAFIDSLLWKASKSLGGCVAAFRAIVLAFTKLARWSIYSLVALCTKYQQTLIPQLVRLLLLYPIQTYTKPIALLQYLVQTYTNPGDRVLDNTCGSGTTLVAARDTGRNAIGIELDPKYCQIAADRCQQLTIFGVTA